MVQHLKKRSTSKWRGGDIELATKADRKRVYLRWLHSRKEKQNDK